MKGQGITKYFRICLLGTMNKTHVVDMHLTWKKIDVERRVKILGRLVSIHSED